MPSQDRALCRCRPLAGHIALPHELGRSRGKADVASSRHAAGFMHTRPSVTPCRILWIPLAASNMRAKSSSIFGVYRFDRNVIAIPLHPLSVFLKQRDRIYAVLKQTIAELGKSPANG